MRTSELAGQAGVNTETLRYYERRGLLTEPPLRRPPVRAAGSDRPLPGEATR